MAQAFSFNLLVSAVFRKFRAGILQDILPVSRFPAARNGKTAIEVVGLFHTSSGIGESARLCVHQLVEAGYKIRCVSVENSFRSLRNKPREFEWVFENTAHPDEIGYRIFHLNPSMMPLAVLGLGLGKYRQSYNIGYWAWELEEIPREWQRALHHINAVFCPSEFTSKSIRRYTQKPVLTVPHPVRVEEPSAALSVRGKLGIPKDTFLVSNIFSFGSAMERKNPEAAIDAFLSVFSGNDKAMLVFKTNSGGESADKKALLEKIAPHSNIRLVDHIWSRDELMSFIRESDIYLSLHRSEGFGLPIAEAMMVGTPVITTNWSGNTDFCNADNSYLVNTDMIPVQSEHPEFSQLGSLVWANPRMDEAVAALKDAYENPERRREKGILAKIQATQMFTQPVYDRALKYIRQKVTKS